MRTTVHPSDSEKWAVLIQRRLGVIVGAALGVVVFVILLTTLACVKLRKRRLHRQQVSIVQKYTVLTSIAARKLLFCDMIFFFKFCRMVKLIII